MQGAQGIITDLITRVLVMEERSTKALLRRCKLKWRNGRKTSKLSKRLFTVIIYSREQKNIQMISEDPLSVYMEKKSKTKDVGIMVATECPLCTSFVDDMEVN